VYKVVRFKLVLFFIIVENTKLPQPSSLEENLISGTKSEGLKKKNVLPFATPAKKKLKNITKT
jgi:hypothetical protein